MRTLIQLFGFKALERLATVLMLFAVCAGCKVVDVEGYGVQQIFADQKRSTISGDKAPYILSLHKRCTAFIIDSAKRIAMTAMHCRPTKGLGLCLQAEKLHEDSCAYPAILDEFLESSPSYELDYVIFRFEFTGALPEKLGELKLASEDALAAMHRSKVDIEMIGYPADKYQQAKLTKSQCLVRVPQVQLKTSADYSSDLIGYWSRSSARLSSHPSYSDMREKCNWISDAEWSRPSFVTDCSVYGGNSGGPIMTSETAVVIGMPATYYPEKSFGSSCHETTYEGQTYWDIFFRPFFGTPKPQTKPSAPFWDQLDRQNLQSHYPEAIPLHLITKRSDFFQKNPQYLASPLAPKDEGQHLDEGQITVAIAAGDKPRVFVSVPPTYKLSGCSADTARPCTDEDRRLSLVHIGEHHDRELYEVTNGVEGQEVINLLAVDGANSLQRHFKIAE